MQLICFRINVPIESHERSHLDRGSSEKHEPSFLPLHDNSRRPLSLFFSSQFDDDFYEFRCSIKELERRLGAVVSLAFDDCATVYGRFKLLDSFEGLLERPIIQVHNHSEFPPLLDFTTDTDLFL